MWVGLYYILIDIVSQIIFGISKNIEMNKVDDIPNNSLLEINSKKIILMLYECNKNLSKRKTHYIMQ